VTDCSKIYQKLKFRHFFGKKINKTTWKNKIKNKLLINKVMQKIGASAKPPSLQEMLSYYKNSQDKFKTKESILIRHFFYKKKVKTFKAKAALEKDKNWNRSIVEPKWVEKGVLAVFNKAFLMSKNSISPILTSDYGYHIIHVLDKKSAKQESFKEAKAKISKFLLEKKQQALFMKWLDKEKKKIKVFKDEKVFQNIQVKWQ